MPTAPITNTAFVKSNAPNSNFGEDEFLWALSFAGRLWWTYLELPQTSGEIHIFIVGSMMEPEPCIVELWGTSMFDEATLTWNTKPPKSSKIGETGIASGWNEIVLANPPKYICLTAKTDGEYAGMLSDDEIAPGYEPYITYIVPPVPPPTFSPIWKKQIGDV